MKINFNTNNIAKQRSLNKILDVACKNALPSNFHFVANPNIGEYVLRCLNHSITNEEREDYWTQVVTNLTLDGVYAIINNDTLTMFTEMLDKEEATKEEDKKDEDKTGEKAVNTGKKAKRTRLSRKSKKVEADKW